MVTVNVVRLGFHLFLALVTCDLEDVDQPVFLQLQLIIFRGELELN